jgi:hypothetical protein
METSYIALYLTVTDTMPCQTIHQIFPKVYRLSNFAQNIGESMLDTLNLYAFSESTDKTDENCQVSHLYMEYQQRNSDLKC